MYAAESRRLLATATTLEASNDVLSKSFLPPSPRYKFSCALNLITTDLSTEDAAVADKFVHYARQAHELDGKGVSYAGDNRVELCEYECQRIISAQVPDLVDHSTNPKELERAERSRKISQGGQRYDTSRRLVVVLGALAAIAGLSGYTVHKHRSNASSSHAGGGQVSSATDADWNDGVFVDGTSTPTAFPTTLTGMPTAEPTVYGNAAAPASAPVAGAYDGDEDQQQQDSGGESGTIASGTSGSTFIDDLRSNPWALGTIAGVLSFVVLGLLAMVLRRNPSTNKSEPLIDAGEVGTDGNCGDAEKQNDVPKPAAVAVPVGDFHADDPEYQTKVVVEDAAPVQPAAAVAAPPTAVQQTLPVERSQSALSTRNHVRQIPVQRSSSTMSAKDKVQQMIEAEKMSRRRSAGGGVRFRSGDDSLVSDTGVPNVPRYSQTETRTYAPPPSPAVPNDGNVEGESDERDQRGRPLPPLQLQ